jgi:hypothetical protein
MGATFANIWELVNSLFTVTLTRPSPAHPAMGALK